MTTPADLGNDAGRIEATRTQQTMKPVKIHAVELINKENGRTNTVVHANQWAAWVNWNDADSSALHEYSASEMLEVFGVDLKELALFFPKFK